jgi:hypothetical protein
LGAADAIIHDPGVCQTILDLTKLSGYREAATPHRAIDRLIKLAGDGWRVVHLVEDNAMERSVESSIRCAEHNIPFCILPNTDESIGAEAPLAGCGKMREHLHSGARALPASPESRNTDQRNQCLGLCSWIPGPPLTGRPGMTREFFSTLLGFLLVRQTLLVERGNPRSTFVVLAASPQSEAELAIMQCQPPPDFSMPGLAG